MNRKRVQELRNVIAGIPQKQMNLNEFYKQNGEPCGTIACIAGWAAIYPPFVEQGLYAKPYLFSVGSAPAFENLMGLSAVARFFDVPAITFDMRLPIERGTHKQIALRRLDALLK